MNDGRRCGLRIDAVESGVSLGAAPAIAVSNGDNRTSRWAAVDGALDRMCVIYFALFRSEPRRRAAHFRFDGKLSSVYRTKPVDGGALRADRA
jgi:hypothetical protein